MKSQAPFILWTIILSGFISIAGCKDSDPGTEMTGESTSGMPGIDQENQVWQMEEFYWECVQKIDTVAYKTLWHPDFIGYPSFGNGVSDKSRIASWIPELHADSTLKFSYTLYKKAVNAIEGVVLVFYDADEIWTNQAGKEVRKDVLKFTHTWKKVDNHWVIIGGLAAIKM